MNYRLANSFRISFRILFEILINLFNSLCSDRIFSIITIKTSLRTKVVLIEGSSIAKTISDSKRTYELEFRRLTMKY